MTPSIKLDKQHKIDQVASDYINEDNKQFNNTLKQLKLSIKQHTHNTKLPKHQLQWYTQYKLLNTQYNKSYHELIGYLTKISAIPYDTQYTHTIHHIINEYDTINSTSQQYYNDINERYQLIKQQINSIIDYGIKRNGENVMIPTSIKHQSIDSCLHNIEQCTSDYNVLYDYYTDECNVLQQQLSRYDDRWLSSLTASDDTPPVQQTVLLQPIDIINTLTTTPLTPNQLNDVYNLTESLWSQYENDIHSIHTKYQVKQQELDTRYNTECNDIFVQCSEQWSDHEHERLKHICQKYIQSGLTRLCIIERLTIEFNTKHDISPRVDYYILSDYYLQHTSNNKSRYDQLLQRLDIRYNDTVRHQCAQLYEELQRKQRVEQSKYELKLRQSTYEQIQLYKQQKSNELHEQQITIQQLHQVELDRKNQRESRMRHQQQQQLELWKQEQEYDRLRQYELQQIECQHKLDEQKSIDIYNNERVAQRQLINQEKQIVLNERKLIEVEQKQLQRDRLDKLISSVAPIIERDPTRVLQDTITSSQPYIQPNKLFRNIDGYNNNELMSDHRLRVAVALADRGIDIQSSAYSRQTILSQSTATVPRRDAVSNIILNDGSGG